MNNTPPAVISRQSRNRIFHINTSGGFTLVEMIVVLLAAGLLGAIAIPGLKSRTDYAKIQKQNGQARIIYMAAQTRLTQYEQNGRLTVFTDMITGSDDGGQPDSYIVPEHIVKEERFYLKAEKGDYQRYCELSALPYSSVEELPRQEQRLIALFDLIDPQIADKTALQNAAICVELDPRPGKAVIYAVFYTDNTRYHEFTYKAKEDITSASVIERDYKTRKETGYGYYGSDTK